MKRILVGVDGSPASAEAAKFAATLASAAHAKLMIVCAVGPYAPIHPDASPHAVQELEKQDRATAARIVAEVAAACAQPGLEVETSVPRGFPSEALVELAPQFDLVVVGDKGRGRVARVLLGSVSNALVQTCPAPVLVVRQKHPHGR